MSQILKVSLLLLLFVGVASGQQPARLEVHTSTGTTSDGRLTQVHELTTSGGVERAVWAALADSALPPVVTNRGSFRLPDAVFKNGAAYFDFGPGIEFVPITGGGASGCLTDDLLDRARALREYSDTLHDVAPKQ